MIPAPYQAGVRKYSGTTRDALGNVVNIWAAPVQVPVHWGSPGAMDEPGQKNRDASVVEWTLCVPPGTVVGERDRIVWRGHEYDVEGEPRDWTFGPWANPVAAILVALKKVEG